MPAGRLVGALCLFAMLGATITCGEEPPKPDAPPAPAAPTPAVKPSADSPTPAAKADAPPTSAPAAAAKASPHEAAASSPAPAASADASASRYTLRYRFLPGEELRWEVVDEKNIDMNVSGTARVAEMYSRSVKIWRVKSIHDDGSAVIENLVDEVDMRQKYTGQMEVRYNSRTDKEPPIYFENVAKSIGIPLSRVTLDARGKLLKRERLTSRSSGAEGEIALPLPEQAVAVGETWVVPADLDVPLKNGTVKKLKTHQTFTLESVDGGVASIRMATQILTPVSDPALQTQIMHRETQGVVRFDVKAGRILSQQIAIDKRILGFAGEASVCQYKVRFTEKLTSRVPDLGAPTKTADDAKKAATQPADAKPVDAKAAVASKEAKTGATAGGKASPIKTADARASAAKSATAATAASAARAGNEKSSDAKPAASKSSSPDAKPSDAKPSAGNPSAKATPADSAPPVLPKSTARRLLPAKADVAPPDADASLPAAAEVASPAPEAPLPPSTKLVPGKSPRPQPAKPEPPAEIHVEE